MSRSTNTHADTFEASEAFAVGLVAERTTNSADDEPSVKIAIDPTQISNLPIVGIATDGGAINTFMRVVTDGRCWAKAGNAIAVTDRDLTCDGQGLLIPWGPGDQRVSVHDPEPMEQGVAELVERLPSALLTDPVNEQDADRR